MFFNVQHRRTNKESLRWTSSASVTNHFCASGNPFINEAMDALARLAANHGAERDPFVEPEAHLDRLGVFHEFW